MARTTIEPDGRILLPAEALEAARIKPGQELELVASEGHLSFTALSLSERRNADEDEFLAGLERALEDVRAERVTRQGSDHQFLAALDAATPPN
jgi:bifunctional DNA-binding transcriptional regulator/antitoxin component of YhaV-PrlF toxin-antitoxin module